jgi:tetratricopeptide (TPR) repeat protein
MRVRPLLRHSAFLARPGQDGDDAIRIGQGAFLVLRVIDLFAPDHAPASDAMVIEYQWRATDQYLFELPPDPEGETSHLRGILDSAQELRLEVNALTLNRAETALAAYAINRRDREYFDEAIDLLETAWNLLRGSPGELEAAMQLGDCLVRASRLEDAARLYRKLSRSGFPHARRRARHGEADVLLASGQPQAAERLYRRVLTAARRVKHEAEAVCAEEGIARALLDQGRPGEAVLVASRLAERAADRAQLVLGPALEAAGDLNAATGIFTHTAAGCSQPDARWRAVASLVRIAARQQDRLAFERWRHVGEQYHDDGLPPVSAELDFWLALACGARSFGARRLANQALDSARALARRAAAPDAVARVSAVEAAVIY